MSGAFLNEASQTLLELGDEAEPANPSLLTFTSNGKKAPFPGLLRVERAGIEPATSGLQSRRSPS
jgi:hypothetical protein